MTDNIHVYSGKSINKYGSLSLTELNVEHF